MSRDSLENQDRSRELHHYWAITWLVGVTNIVSFFNNNPSPPSQVLFDKILKKKNLLVEMLIRQIIEIKLRVRASLAVDVLLQLAIFMAKQKSLRKIFGRILIY